MSKHQPSLIVGLLVLDWQGQPAEIVATPFVSEAAARQWAQQNGVTSFLLLPARLAGAR